MEEIPVWLSGSPKQVEPLIHTFIPRLLILRFTEAYDRFFNTADKGPVSSPSWGFVFTDEENVVEIGTVFPSTRQLPTHKSRVLYRISFIARNVDQA
jgi:hypothetical protein